MTTFPMQPFYRAAPLTVETNHAPKYFEEDDGGSLEDGVLDQSGLDSGLEMSPHMAGSRRESFAVSSALFSPKSEDWRSVEMQSVPSQGGYGEQGSNNPFAAHQHQAPPAYGQQGQWSISSSGSATPLQQYDGLPSDFDASTSIFQRPQPMQGPTPFSNPTHQVAMFQSLAQSQALPTAPQKEWGHHHAMLKRDRPTSPLHRSLSELRRGDGIRKKNARFEIPAERNLSNIDHLISQSTDENEIKELKQQKRLLRNRQAALDSRQRKKQHTERLEDEKKQYTGMMADLEDQVKQRTMEVNHLMHQLETMQLDKQELIRAHTIETTELRKRVNALVDHVQTLENSAMHSTAPVAHDPPEYPPAFGDMDGLTMEGSWDSMPFLGDFSADHAVEAKQELQVVTAKKAENSLVPVDSDKTGSQGGLLLMLFLVGAFVLSSRSAPSIPAVSDDVRAASAAILDNVLRDAGVAQSGSALEAMAPQPSTSANWAAAQGHHHHAMPMAGNVVTPSMLGELTDALTQPTQQQANDQIFSLSATQYNGVTSQDFLRDVPADRSAATSQRRKNLAEALANMRIANKHTAADVYTRSLLWDQIPSDVVRSFARMMAECNTRNDGSSCGNDLET